MIRRVLSFVCLSFLIATIAAPASGRGQAGSTGAAFLEETYGARWGAMSRSGTAWSDDAFGLLLNPAGAALQKRSEVGFAHEERIVDISNQALTFARPMKRGGIGVHLVYLDLGNIDRTTIASGEANTILGQAEGSDLALGATYGLRVSDPLSLGITLKWIHSELDGIGANAVAADFGAIYHTPLKGLTLGLSALHLGTRLKFVRDRTDLPITFRAGIGYRPEHGRWGIAVDLEKVRRLETSFHIGGEWWAVRETLALRAGFNTASEEAEGFSLGLGGRFNDIKFDYAYTPFGSLGDRHQFGAAYEFGPLANRSPYRASTVQPAAERPSQVSRAGTTLVSERTAERGAFAEPFIYRNGPVEFDWMGEGIRQVFSSAWRQDGFDAPDQSQARYLVSGSYWVLGDVLLVSATLNRGGIFVAQYDIMGKSNEPFLVWEELLTKVQQALAIEGEPVRVPKPSARRLNEAPAPAPAKPEPFGPVEPAPAPIVSVPIGQIELGEMREYPSMSSTAMTENLRRDLSNALLARRWGGDAASASHSFSATVAYPEPGRISVYGRLIHRETGIPIAVIDLEGDATNPDLLAQRLADKILESF